MPVFLRSLKRLPHSVDVFNSSGDAAEEASEPLQRANEDFDNFFWVADEDWKVLQAIGLLEAQQTTAFFDAVKIAMTSACTGDVFSRPLVRCPEMGQEPIQLKHLVQWSFHQPLFSKLLLVSSILCSGVVAEVKRNLRIHPAPDKVQHLLLHIGSTDSQSPTGFPDKIRIKKTQKNSVLKTDQTFRVQFMIVQAKFGKKPANIYSMPLLLKGFHKSNRWSPQALAAIVQEQGANQHQVLNTDALLSFPSFQYIGAVYSQVNGSNV